MNEYKNNQPVMDEETMLRESPVIEKKGTAKGKVQRNWKGVTIGGVSGIMVGAAGVIAAHAVPSSHSEVPGVTVQETTAAETAGEIAVANSVSDDMSFREAIEAAREEVGPGGAFSWHGNVYSTYKADDPEWIEMGAEGQKAHCQEIVEQVQAEPYVEEVPVVDVFEEEEVGTIPEEEESFEEPSFEDEPASEEEPVDEEPAEEEEPVEEENEPVEEEEVVEEEEPVEKETPVEEVPVEEEAPVEEVPVEEEAPVEEEPAEELVAEVVETSVAEVVEEEPVVAEDPVAVEEPAAETTVKAEEEAPAEPAAEEPEEAPTEEPAEESAPEPVWKHLEKPTIEQIIKLYKASVPVMKSEPEVEIKILDIEKNDDEPVQPVDVKASNDVAAESNGGVKVDIFSEVREIANEDDNSMDDIASADDLLQ